MTDAPSPLEALIARWRQEQISYPKSDIGRHAAAAVRCCANELEAALAAEKGTVTAGEPPAPRSRLDRIRETLHPTDPTYCAEPLDIDDARWLLDELSRVQAEGRPVVWFRGRWWPTATQTD